MDDSVIPIASRDYSRRTDDKTSVPSLDTWVKWVGLIGSIFVILAGAATSIIWMTGGLTPGSTVQANALKDQLSDVQRNVGDIKQRLDALPRPSDFSAVQTTIAALSAEFNLRMTAEEHAQILLRSDFDHTTQDDKSRFEDLSQRLNRK